MHFPQWSNSFLNGGINLQFVWLTLSFVKHPLPGPSYKNPHDTTPLHKRPAISHWWGLNLHHHLTPHNDWCILLLPCCCVLYTSTILICLGCGLPIVDALSGLIDSNSANCGLTIYHPSIPYGADCQVFVTWVVVFPTHSLFSKRLVCCVWCILIQLRQISYPTQKSMARIN